MKLLFSLESGADPMPYHLPGLLCALMRNWSFYLKMRSVIPPQNPSVYVMDHPRFSYKTVQVIIFWVGSAQL